MLNIRKLFRNRPSSLMGLNDVYVALSDAVSETDFDLFLKTQHPDLSGIKTVWYGGFCYKGVLRNANTSD